MSLYTQALTDVGFTRHQAATYSFLVENGPQTASIIARHTNMSRTLMYRVLDELEEYQLVTRDDPKGAVSTFTPAHPIKLHDMVERRKKEAEQAAVVVESVVDGLVSQYNKTIGKPGVQFYEGARGMEQMYDNILQTGKDIHLIRPAVEPVYQNKIVPILAQFVKRRVAKKMHVSAITPNDDLSKKNEKEDAVNLITRTNVSKEAYTTPVEINIYGDRVAILSFGKELLGTIIESPQIAQALRELFMLAQKGANSTD